MRNHHPKKIAAMLCEEKDLDLTRLSYEQLEQIADIFRVAFSQVTFEQEKRLKEEDRVNRASQSSDERIIRFPRSNRSHDNKR